MHSNKQAHWFKNVTTCRQTQFMSQHPATSMVKYKLTVSVHITNSFSAAVEISGESIIIVLKYGVNFTQCRTHYSSLSGINPHHAEKFQFAFVKFVLRKSNAGVAVNSDFFFPRIIELGLDLILQRCRAFYGCTFPWLLGREGHGASWDQVLTPCRMPVSELLCSLYVSHFEMPCKTITYPPLLLPDARQNESGV